MATVLGIFANQTNATDAIRSLEDRGYNPKDISIVMKDSMTRSEAAGSDVAGGAVSGATAGGILGALAGLLFATGVIPGIGALLIGGPIAAALGLSGAAATTVSGALTGALAGGLIGALTSLGLSEDEARLYEERIREGGILVAIPARIGEETEVRILLDKFGADQIKTVSDLDSEDIELSGESRYYARNEDYYPMGMKGGETTDAPMDERRPKKRTRRS